MPEPMVLGPNLIIADEPVSMLDVSTRGEVLSLIRRAARDRGVAVILGSDDLSVLERVCNGVLVMHRGRIVEQGPVPEIFGRPRHPCTRALISAIPTVDETRKRTRTNLKGQPPQPSERPPGCSFHPRLPCSDVSNCRTEIPQLEKRNHMYACWDPFEVLLENLA